MTIRRLARRLLQCVVVACLLSLGVVLLYRLVPPPGTPLMLMRAVEGQPIQRHWLGPDEVPPAIVEAVLASEDQRFCGHHGFDLVEIERSLAEHKEGGALRGASTISQQTAKNLFLLPVRSFLRKGLEAWFTVLIEALWPKWRIAQLYLNDIEWGPGVYGVEAASQHAFGHPAARLTRHEAALLAAVLPNPLHWSAAQPSTYIRSRAATIQGRMDRQEADTQCVQRLGRAS